MPRLKEPKGNEISRLTLSRLQEVQSSAHWEKRLCHQFGPS